MRVYRRSLGLGKFLPHEKERQKGRKLAAASFCEQTFNSIPPFLNSIGPFVYIYVWLKYCYELKE